MALSIVVPDVKFSRRSQVLNIPAISKNHVFAVFGPERDRSLANLNIGEANGIVVGSVEFSADGALVTGNTNAIRFKGLRQPNGKGCTQMAIFKTGPVAGEAGVCNFWSESQQTNDSFQRRIYNALTNGVAHYHSFPPANDPVTSRKLLANTEYVLSLTRAVQGTPSVLRLHNPDGSVAMASPINEYVGTNLPYAADVCFDIGVSASSAQVGVYMRAVALWTGEMSEADISAGAALLYQTSRA